MDNDPFCGKIEVEKNKDFPKKREPLPMTTLQQFYRPVCNSFPQTARGRKRASWFILTILAIAMPVSSARTSDLLRCFDYFFDLLLPQRRFYRFMGSPKLPWDRIRRALWCLIPNPCTAGRLVLALDDSINPKSGKMVHACHNFFDHAAKENQCKYPWSQNIVCLGLLKFVKGRWACLPLIARFYHLEKDLNANPVKIGKTPVEFQTKIEQAVVMIGQVADAFANSNLLIVCDSWFGNSGLWKPLHKELGSRFHLLTRLRSNSNIFDKCPPPSGIVGRPRKYGKKLGNAKSLAPAYRKMAQTVTANLYGKIRDLLVYDRVITLKTLRCSVRVVWVFNKSSWVALCTTDLTLSVVDIVELYGARWKIEALFKELKHDVGSSHTQTRNPSSVINHLQFCMLTTSLVWIFADNLDFVPTRRHSVQGRDHFAFSDARRAFVNAAMNDDFDWLSPKVSKPFGKSALRRILRLVA